MPKNDMKAALRTASRTLETSRFGDAVDRMMEANEPSRLMELPLSQVRPNPDQPRRIFDEAALEELAASIKELGVLQPVAVRRSSEGHYDLIAGERRLRAARIAGLKTIPAVLHTLDDRETLEASLTENLQREDLSPEEEARIFHRMIEELGYSIRSLAQRLGKGKGYIESRLHLLKLSPDLREMVSRRPDTLTHAREIAKIENPELRDELVRAVDREGMPLQELRRRIQEQEGMLGDFPEPPHPETLPWEEGLPYPESPSVWTSRQTDISAEAVLSEPGISGTGAGAASDKAASDVEAIPQGAAGSPEASGQAGSGGHPILKAARALGRELAREDLPADPELRRRVAVELELAAGLIGEYLEKLRGERAVDGPLTDRRPISG